MSVCVSVCVSVFVYVDVNKSYNKQSLRTEESRTGFSPQQSYYSSSETDLLPASPLAAFRQRYRITPETGNEPIPIKLRQTWEPTLISSSPVISGASITAQNTEDRSALSSQPVVEPILEPVDHQLFRFPPGSMTLIGAVTFACAGGGF